MANEHSGIPEIDSLLELIPIFPYHQSPVMGEARIVSTETRPDGQTLARRVALELPVLSQNRQASPLTSLGVPQWFPVTEVVRNTGPENLAYGLSFRARDCSEGYKPHEDTDFHHKRLRYGTDGKLSIEDGVHIFRTGNNPEFGAHIPRACDYPAAIDFTASAARVLEAALSMATGQAAMPDLRQLVPLPIAERPHALTASFSEEPPYNPLPPPADPRQPQPPLFYFEK